VSRNANDTVCRYSVQGRSSVVNKHASYMQHVLFSTALVFYTVLLRRVYKDVVGLLKITLLQICCWTCQQKTFENRSTLFC